MLVKTKAELIMIIRLVRKYCSGKKVSSAMLSPDGIRSVGSLHDLGWMANLKLVDKQDKSLSS